LQTASVGVTLLQHNLREGFVMGCSTKHLLLCSVLASSLAAPALADPPPPEERDSGVEELVVTGSMAVRQGGAQDANKFRAEAVNDVPIPESLTPEGLMGDYNLQIPGPPCAKLFCLTAEATPADLLGRAEDRVFVGLGFNTSIKAATWKREPLNLVAVVDKSGSMDGEPLELVRKSLLQVLSQLGPADQLSIVLYGDRSHVHLQPTRVSDMNRDRVAEAIRAIESEGSTNMEEGLKVGYDTAFASRARFRGATRVMLFTDEQPNVGATDADSFMGMARAASEAGIGLTTIGVGVQYDGALATRISSVRGGNLFFMADAGDVKTVFQAKLDTMVSELAHDLELKLTPAAGYKISAVYGVPGEVLQWGENGTIRVVVPTAFLSNEGGGVFVTLAKSEENLPAVVAADGVLDVGLTYVAASDGRPGADALRVAPPSGAPSQGLQLAQALVDEYLGLKAATAAFHAGDEDAAYKTFRSLSLRLDRVPDRRLAPERKMVAGLLARTAYLAGYAGEAPKAVGPLAMLGVWEVTGTLGEPGLRRGDRLELKADSEAVIVRKGAGKPADASYETDGRRLKLSVDEKKEPIFAYRVSGDRMTMVIPEDGSTLNLKRVPLQPAT
jgi:Ca-activated chloride channel homolog